MELGIEYIFKIKQKILSVKLSKGFHLIFKNKNDKRRD